MTTFNMAAVESAKFDALPEGTYKGVIEKVTFGTSKENHPKWDLQIDVTEGQYKGRKFFYTLSFHPNAAPVSKGILEKLGATGITTNPEVSLEDDGAQLVGIAVTLNNKHREYNGEKQDNVSSIRKAA